MTDAREQVNTRAKLRIGREKRLSRNELERKYLEKTWSENML